MVGPYAYIVTYVGMSNEPGRYHVPVLGVHTNLTRGIKHFNAVCAHHEVAADFAFEKNDWSESRCRIIKESKPFKNGDFVRIEQWAFSRSIP